MTATVLELSQEAFERLETYRRKHRLSRNAALLRLLEQADPTRATTPGWLEHHLEGAPEDDEEVSAATRRRIEAARRSLKREGGVPADRAGR